MVMFSEFTNSSCLHKKGDVPKSEISIEKSASIANSKDIPNDINDTIVTPEIDIDKVIVPEVQVVEAIENSKPEAATPEAVALSIPEKRELPAIPTLSDANTSKDSDVKITKFKKIPKLNLSCFHKKKPESKKVALTDILKKDSSDVLEDFLKIRNDTDDDQNKLPSEIKAVEVEDKVIRNKISVIKTIEQIDPLIGIPEDELIGDYDVLCDKTYGDVTDDKVYKAFADNYVLSKVEHAKFGISWSTLTDVVNSGIKSIVSIQEKKLQEAMFEIISTEAKYYAGLEIIMNHYYKSYLFTPINDKCGYVNPIDKHHIFSNIFDVMKTSKNLLADFELRWKNDRPFLHDVCDILYEHAIGNSFKQYVIYIRNQSFQQEALRRLMESTLIKKEMDRLQSFEVVKGLPLDSYLLLPMQRLTRYRLLAENVLKILLHENIDKKMYASQIENARKVIQQMSSLLALSQSGKIDLDNKALLMDLLNKIDFPKDCKMLSISGKLLLKEGEYSIDSISQKHGPQIVKKSSHFLLLLFNDIMMIGKRSGSRIQILDYCARKDVVFSPNVLEMLREKNKNKKSYEIYHEELENSFRFYLRFENSCNSYLRDPIILKVKNREELDSWKKYLPDFCNISLFDYSSPYNEHYWMAVKKKNLLTEF